MQETKQTLYELIAGIVVCLLLFSLGNIFVSNRIAYTLGLLVGGMIAWFMSICEVGTGAGPFVSMASRNERILRLNNSLKSVVPITGITVSVCAPATS